MTTDTTRTFEIRIHSQSRATFDAMVSMLRASGATFDRATKAWTLVTTDGSDAIAEIAHYTGGRNSKIHRHQADLTIVDVTA
jgi:hypothetical protein